MTVIDESDQLGRSMVVMRRDLVLDALRKHGAALVTGAADIEADATGVSYTNARGQRRRICADRIVQAPEASADSSLARRLQAIRLNAVPIGDCNRIGYIDGAMRDAARLAVEAAAG